MSELKLAAQLLSIGANATLLLSTNVLVAYLLSAALLPAGHWPRRLFPSIVLLERDRGKWRLEKLWFHTLTDMCGPYVFCFFFVFSATSEPCQLKLLTIFSCPLATIFVPVLQVKRCVIFGITY